MQFKKRVSAIFGVFLTGMTLFSCNTQEQVDSSLLVGTWEQVNLEEANKVRPNHLRETCHVEHYRSDGSFTIDRKFVSSGKRLRTNLSGTYSVKGNVVEIYFDGFVDYRQTPVKAMESFRILEISSYSLVARGMIGQVLGEPETREDLSKYFSESKRIEGSKRCT